MLVTIWLLGISSAVIANTVADYVGNYRLADGHILAIAELELNPSAPRVLAFTNLTTGRIGVLTRLGKDEVALAAGLMSGDEAARLRFERSDDGRVIALSLSERGQAPRRALRLGEHAQQITIASGDAQLEGTLWFPSGEGPFPAVVLVPAGAVGRTAPGPFTNFFLSEGFAVLAYDRRRESTSFQVYAGDAVAAVTALRRQPAVRCDLIGLWGHSQGGWLSLIAAGRSVSVAFVMNLSGMLVPAWQQELYRLAAEAAADGVTPEVVQEAVAFETRLMKVAASGAGWGEIANQLALEPPPAWHALVYKPGSLEELRRVWRDDFSFDPRPHVAQIRQPVLALFGGLDRSTPIESAANLVHALGPTAPLTVEFFPTGNHALLDARTGGNAEIPGLSRFAPGVFESMRRWLQQVTPKPRRDAPASGSGTKCPEDSIR